MPVVDQLPSLSARIGKAQTIHQIVQAHLQDLQKILAGFAGATSGKVKLAVELALQHAVCATHLLLLAQLLGITRVFAGAARAMLTRTSIAALKRAFRHTLVAF